MKSSIHVLALVVLTPGSVCADVTVVRTLTLQPHAAVGSIHAQSVMQLHGPRARRETDVLVKGPLADQFHYPVRTLTWVLLDKGVVHWLDASKQDFQKVPLSRWAKHLAERDAPSIRSGYEISQSWSRVLPEEEFKVIKGQRCRKFIYEWRFEIQNPETYAKKHYGVRTTLWLTDLSPALVQTLLEEKTFQADYHKRLGGAALEELNAVTMQYASAVIGLDKETLFTALSQGTARLKRIMGYPMASQTEWFLVGYKQNKPLFTVQSELETLSLKPLSEAMFVPSRNFKGEDSYDEFHLTRL